MEGARAEGAREATEPADDDKRRHDRHSHSMLSTHVQAGLADTIDTATQVQQQTKPCSQFSVTQQEVLVYLILLAHYTSTCLIVNTRRPGVTITVNSGVSSY